MLRKMFALLLSTVLLLSAASPAFAAAAEEELLEVTLNVYSNRQGHVTVDGLYRDNVLYLDPYTICDLTGAMIYEDAGDSITFSLHKQLRLIQVTDAGRMHENLTMGRAYSVSADIPVVYYDYKIWISASQILRYMGAVVGYGEDETSPTHLMVTMPYTIYDLVMDYVGEDGYWFSWAEAEGKLVDPEDMVYLAALDTVFFGYDSNLMAYISPSHGKKVEKDIYSDLLSEILRSSGAEVTEEGYSEVDLFEDAGDIWTFSAAWIGEVLGWIEDSAFAGKLNSSMSGALNASGVLLSAGGDYLESLDAAMQFANMSQSQKNLLEDTLNLVSASNPYYQQLPVLFEASEEVSKLIGDKYAAQEKAAWDGIYSLMVNTATTMINSVNPIALALDSITSIVKLDPLLDDLLNDEKSITFAAEAQNVALIAHSLMSEDWKNLYNNNFYMLTDNTRYHEYLKQDIILELKSTLLIRKLLASTGWLTEAAQNMMEYRIGWTAELLNKAQMAQCTTFGKVDYRDEDITWIRYLAGSGSMGYVVASGGNVYYWQYSSDSFYEYGVDGFGHVNAVNKLVCRNSDGMTKTLLEANGYGQFAIVNNMTLFYRSYDGSVCSIDLNGKNPTVWDKGYFSGVSDKGNYVYYKDSEGYLKAINVRSKQTTSLGYGMTYVTSYGGRIYVSYSAQDEEAQKGRLTLYSMAPDGSDRIVICTTPTLYDYASGNSCAAVAQMRFSKNYLYFSYGSIAGTGLFFQGGKIIRAKYDGSESTVVAGKDDLVGAQFSVNADDTVSTQGGVSDEVYFESMRTCGINNGTVYCYNDLGQEIAVAQKGDYDLLGSGTAGVYNDADDSMIQLGFAQIVNGKAYYMLHLAKLNTGDWMSWREEYVRDMTVLYCKDLETGTITVLFQC